MPHRAGGAPPAEMPTRLPPRRAGREQRRQDGGRTGAAAAATPQAAWGRRDAWTLAWLRMLPAKPQPQRRQRLVHCAVHSQRSLEPFEHRLCAHLVRRRRCTPIGRTPPAHAHRPLCIRGGNEHQRLRLTVAWANEYRQLRGFIAHVITRSTTMAANNKAR
jgi:hypothetical protein